MIALWLKQPTYRNMNGSYHFNKLSRRWTRTSWQMKTSRIRPLTTLPKMIKLTRTWLLNCCPWTNSFASHTPGTRDSLQNAYRSSRPSSRTRAPLDWSNRKVPGCRNSLRTIGLNSCLCWHHRRPLDAHWTWPQVVASATPLTETEESASQIARPEPVRTAKIETMGWIIWWDKGCEESIKAAYHIQQGRGDSFEDTETGYGDVEHYQRADAEQ